MAFKDYDSASLVNLEDRLRTVTDNLKQVRELLASSGMGTIELQLGSFQHYLRRMEKLSFNALAKARHDAYSSVTESKAKYETNAKKLP